MAVKTVKNSRKLMSDRDKIHKLHGAKVPPPKTFIFELLTAKLDSLLSVFRGTLLS